MNLIKSLENELKKAFQKAGIDDSVCKINVSNRPDLCEYQCNSAMALAKALHKAPIEIAKAVVAEIDSTEVFSMAEACMPGFINLNVSENYLQRFVSEMAQDEVFGFEKEEPKTIIVDYGGPNVAKPLHIGHLRSAIIGEAVKRMLKFAGNEMIGDIHLGDFGLQFGLIIEELKLEKGSMEADFTIEELEKIYPAASARSKEDPDFMKASHEATVKLQSGDPSYRAVLDRILEISVRDLKKNYENLNVHFELWKGESDAQPYIPELMEILKKENLVYESEGALVVDVQEETDKIEIPPCIVLKSDGGALYATTDLATVLYRMKDYNPAAMIYLADKRQELHYTQFFRVSRKAKIVSEDTGLTFIGFGTMNGKDGKPFKTRSGGVMRLADLISDVNNAVFEKMKERYDESEIKEETVKMIGLAAIKYADLSNQAKKDYIFDIDRFASFEGNTGPYVLYTIVRIKSILRKFGESAKGLTMQNLPSGNVDIKNLLNVLSGFPVMMKDAVAELGPQKICAYIYHLSDAFNSFYHNVPILNESDEETKKSYIALSDFTKRILETCIDILGFSAPEEM